MAFTRWSKRFKKTFGSKEENWNENFRQPPKPEHYYTKQTGKCRWCGKIIVNKDGTIIHNRHWHPRCLDKYMFIYHPGETRKVVYKRDSGICKWCSRKSGGWQVDHIRPLVEQKGKSIEELDFTYWELNNLQTLCSHCHHEKSGKESTGRAVKRKTKNAIRWKSFREVFGA